MIVGFHLVKGITACSTGETVIGDDKRKHLDLLIKYAYPEYLNVFWHMEMAWSIIIGYIFHLKEAPAKELLDTTELNGQHFQLKYFPSKFASIKNLSGKYKLYMYSDMSQFNDCVFTENPTVDDCIAKAKEAAELGEKTVSSAKKLDIDAKVLTSPIRIFEKVYIGKYDDRGNPKQKGIDLPTTLVNDSWVATGEDYLEEFKQDLAHLAYECVHGGWIESFWKGFFPNSADFDIASAYSSKLANLLDLRHGTWVRSPIYDPNATYGFCIADVKMTSSFHPILYNTDVENHFTPIGFYEEYAIQKSELDIIDEFKLGTYEIKDGYWWTCKRPYKPLSYLAGWLGQLKNEYEGFDREFVKRVLNGLWGMLLQLKKEKQPDGTMKQVFGEHFNSVWGSIAECETRLDVFRFCMRALNEGRKVLHIAVDGVLTDEPVSFVDRSKEKQPGEWRLEANCPSLVISSGCVAIQDKMGKGEFGMDYNWLVSEINKKPKATEYPETKLSPMTLAKCINLNQYDRIGDIEEITKTIDIHSDVKRQYPKEPKNGGELLKGQFDSVPLDMGMIHNMNLSHKEDDGD
jgi:hypothetical protein